MAMQATTRKRGNGLQKVAGESSNESNDNSMPGVDVEGGQGADEANISISNDKRGDEREELLALYFRRRMKDVKQMIADGRFYAVVDTLRPYFDVDTGDVVRKLIYSLLPNIPTSNEAGRRAIHKRYTSKPDLYGPFIMALTMAAILTLSVELKDDWPRHYAEQTILSTSVFLAFACWLGFTCLVKVGFFALGEMMSWTNCACVIGYALSGHCIALAANLIFSYLFFPCWVVFVGLSSISLGQQLSNRSVRSNQYINALIIAVAILNFCASLTIRNKILGFEIVSQLVSQGANTFGGHKTALDNNLDVITDDKGNMVIRPHSQ